MYNLTLWENIFNYICLLKFYLIIINTAPVEDLTGIKLEEDEKELELQLALKKTQRLKEGHTAGIQKTVETIKQELLSAEENQAGNIVLNSTAEFCRTLGDIPTYGLAGNREENGQELMVC